MAKKRIDFRKQISSPLILKAIEEICAGNDTTQEKAAYQLLVSGAESFINKKTASYLLTVEKDFTITIKSA